MSKKITTRSAGWLYCFIHFSLEVACFYFLFSRISDHPIWWLYALLFDAIAFLLQSVFGVICDKFTSFPFGIIGLAFVLTALILPFNVISLIIIGLGNAMVHVDGAEHTLRNSNKKIAPNAIFVGGGSFGVITGQLLGANANGYLILIPIILIVISIAINFILYKKHDLNTIDNPLNQPFFVASNINEILLIILILFAIAVRSYIAYALPIEWKKTTTQAIFLFSFMGLGKMLGGVIADKYGYKIATIISLVISLPFLLFGNSLMALSLVGVLIFNMCMPVTVGILFSKLPDSPGLAFGISTVGLFFGIIPALIFTLPTLLSHQIVILVLSIIALISILICLRKEKKNAI